MLCAEWQSLHTGSFFVGVGHGRRMDAGGEQLVDAAVALARRCAAMLARFTLERGSAAGSSRWAVWQSAQLAVTVRPHSQQSLAVDALEVVLDDVVLLALVAHGRLLPGAVTVGAQGRHVAREGRRGRVVLAERRRGCRGSRGTRARPGCPARPAVRACSRGTGRRPRRGRSSNRPSAAMVRHGRARRPASPPVWHCTQAILRVARARQLVLVHEQRDRLPAARPPSDSGSPWQRRQSWSAMPCV